MSGARLVRGGGQETPAERAENKRGTTSLSGNRADLPVPEISDDLLSYLDRMFPDRLSLIETLGSKEAAEGARKVVEHLTHLAQEQNEKS